MDVVHENPMVVQEYLRGRLPFAVRVLPPSALAAHGLGGGVISFKDRQAAYLRYDTPQGKWSLVVHEAGMHAEESETAPLYQWGARRVSVQHVHGYPVARWNEAGLVYTLISDAPEKELSTFFQKRWDAR
jgi:hypothetical protein